MGYFLFLVLLLFVFLSLKIECNFFNPVTLLCGFWSILCLGSLLHLYGMYITSDFVYFITLLGAMGFCCGFLLSKNMKFSFLANKDKLREGKGYFFDYKRYICVVIVMILYCMSRFIVVFKMLKMGYSLDIIRLIYFGHDVYGFKISRFYSIFEIFIHLPALYACMAITAVNLVLPKDKMLFHLKTTVISLFWFMIAQIINGGRTIVFVFAMEVCVAYFVVNKAKINKQHFFSSKKIKILIVGVVSFVALYFLSIYRTNSRTYDFMKALYSYFCGCFPHMSLRFQELNISASDYTWGISLLSGFLRPLALVWKYLVGAFPDIYQRTIDIGGILQEPIMIGPGLKFNAYVLPVFYFYYDCGLIGVFIDSVICGVICQIFYKKAICINSNLSYSLYMLIVHGISTSMIRYNGNLVYYVYAFFTVRLLFNKKKIKFSLERNLSHG